ncbi:hypothetical protein ACHAXS_001965, partial [Conticribra weissflogii]
QELELREKDANEAARVAEELRAKKQEQHRLITQHRFEKQRLEIEEKMKKRDEIEREREAKIELKRLVDAQAVEAKRK